MKKSNNKKGFTLVELVIVVAVIAILSAILIPTIGSVIKDAKDAAVKSDLRTVITNKMVETEEDVPAGYFYCKDGENITYVLYWNGSEVTICEGNLHIDNDATKAKIATVSTNNSVITVTAVSNYTLTVDTFAGKFDTLKVTKADGTGNP